MTLNNVGKPDNLISNIRIQIIIIVIWLLIEHCTDVHNF